MKTTIMWFVLAYDPLLKDTDGNGIIDSEEDLDQDGLSNKKEVETSPVT